ncbi:hypothetical protein [Inquilinus limosus]|nr:hypothetical protein [Inquilinus limosus]
MSQDQLALLVVVAPEAVKAELARREAYPDLGTGLSDLAQAALNLEGVLLSVKKTAATRAVLDTNILKIIRRLLTRARIEGHDIKEPSL